MDINLAAIGEIIPFALSVSTITNAYSKEIKFIENIFIL
jgi:hypothetical protein